MILPMGGPNDPAVYEHLVVAAFADAIRMDPDTNAFYFQDTAAREEGRIDGRAFDVLLELGWVEVIGDVAGVTPRGRYWLDKFTKKNPEYARCLNQ